MEILYAALIVGGVGLIIGIILSVSGKFLAVPVDEKEIAIREVLPGNNCGGCGYAGCDGLAAAIAKGESAPNACPVGGAEVAKKIGDIVGIEAELIKHVAYVRCAGDCDSTRQKYNYVGNMNCIDAASIPGGGGKACSYGCLGYGTCVNVCDFNAIEIVNGIAKVDKEKCVACGKCVAACPKKLIELIPYEAKYVVKCSSKDRGKDVKNACDKGCIGCGLCAKNCEYESIEFKDNIAHIDQTKCQSCGVCMEKCPVKAILKLHD